jgi:hypothetical protein
MPNRRAFETRRLGRDRDDAVTALEVAVELRLEVCARGSGRRLGVLSFGRS